MQIEEYGFAIQEITNDKSYPFIKELQEPTQYPYRYYFLYNGFTFAYLKENIGNITCKIFLPKGNKTILIDKNKQFYQLGRTNAILSKIIYTLEFYNQLELASKLKEFSTILSPRTEKEAS